MDVLKDLNTMAMDAEPCIMTITKGNRQIVLLSCIVDIKYNYDYSDLGSWNGDKVFLRKSPSVEIHAIGVPDRRGKIIQEAVLEEVEEYTPSRLYNFDE